MTTTFTKRERVLALLQNINPGHLTALQIAEALQLVPRSSDAVGQVLRDLEAEGLVVATRARRGGTGARFWRAT